MVFDFFWHLRGSFALDMRTSNEAALDSLERLLDRQRKLTRDRGRADLVFDDPLWSNPFGPNWLAMVIYDRGRFWIEQGFDGRVLRYDLRSLHGMIFCLLGAFMFFAFGIAAGGLLGGIQFAALAFGWLYGMNILLALVRVPRAIRKAVRAR